MIFPYCPDCPNSPKTANPSFISCYVYDKRNINLAVLIFFKTYVCKHESKRERKHIEIKPTQKMFFQHIQSFSGANSSYPLALPCSQAGNWNMKFCWHHRRLFSLVMLAVKTENCMEMKILFQKLFHLIVLRKRAKRKCE